MSHYARKLDENQRAIVRELEARGVRVQSLAAVGMGVPDVACWHRGRWTLLEIKRDAKAKLTPAQETWHARFPGAATVVRSVTDALAALGLLGCLDCHAGSLEHDERCGCRCHLRNRNGE